MITGIFKKYFILSMKSKRMIVSFLLILILITIIQSIRERSVRRNVLKSFLFFYVFMVFLSTVFARIDWKVYSFDFKLDFSKARLVPLISYSVDLLFRNADLQQIVMNVLMLFPVGFLLQFAFNTMNFWKCVLIVLGLSATIEFLQLLYACGMCEVDDLIHNTLGGMCGYGCAVLLRQIAAQFPRKLFKGSRRK